MPFNTLLLTSLMPGTNVRESGVEVSVKPLAGETILFFATDNEDVRKDLKIQRGEAVCDYVVFYSKISKKPLESRTVLCLLELKSNKTKHSIEQTLSTCKHLQQCLKDTACWPRIQHIIWKGYVRCDQGSAITLTKSYDEQIKGFFGDRKNFKVTHNPDIGDFLRK